MLIFSFIIPCCPEPGRYDAPEILVGDVCTPAADVWSFGCLIGEMIAGACLMGMITSMHHLRNTGTG